MKDIYFDDQKWVVRCFVVETGSWLSSRKVLISPIAIGSPDWAARVLPVSITKEQVKNSPDIDTDKPVSRQNVGYSISHRRDEQLVGWTSVLIAPQWIQDMSWPDATIAVNLTRQAVKDAPAYEPSLPLNRDHEMDLYRHHDRAGYWAEEVRLENPQFHVIESAAPGANHKHT